MLSDDAARWEGSTARPAKVCTAYLAETDGSCAKRTGFAVPRRVRDGNVQFMTLSAVVQKMCSRVDKRHLHAEVFVDGFRSDLKY